LKGTGTLNQAGFDRLLAALDDDREAAGPKYEVLRANLIRFFEWRGDGAPEEHADETLDRVARKFAAGAEGREEIRDLTSYCIGVARLLLHEVYREQAKRQKALRELPTQEVSAAADETEARLECLRRALEGLPPSDRELVVQYYQGERSAKIENRRRLAERRKVSAGTLRMQALRLRQVLEVSVVKCLESIEPGRR
jgi:DNA-directed RNA polymerase specialized sigma24 family protein